ncbi:MAG: GspE/PulE family protein [Syntrophobacteria bacterium]
MRRKKRRLLGEILRDSGLITEDQLDTALKKQKQERAKPLGQILVAMGAVDEEQIAKAMWEQRRIPYVDLDTYAIDPNVIELVPERLARAYRALPLFKIGGTLTVAMVDPLNIVALDDLRVRTKCEIEPAISTEEKILRALDQYYKMDDSINKLIQDVVDEGNAQVGSAELTQSRVIETSEIPIIKLANVILQQAVRDGASDVHIEPAEKDVKVRYRIDGVLHQIRSLPKSMQEPIVSRFKVWAELDIAKKRTAQDGRFRLNVNGKKVEVRLSTFPTIYGENLVMRLLDPSAAILSLNQVGFAPKLLSTYTNLIKMTQGMVLVTGPTGSGKTTTLYATLHTISDPSLNIITVEDPVEYRLKLIRQTQVNPKAGVTFATGLRAIVRQDPDVIMVGEIRDLETAQMAMQASLTGHLVFSTLHTNEAPSAVTRLLDIGVEPFLVATAVTGILAQRLVRTVCPSCKEAYMPPIQTLEHFGVAEQAKGREFWRGRGCQACRFTGYRGRTALFELLTLTDSIKELIHERRSAVEIRKVALKSQALHPLLRDGMQKVVKGITTFDELAKVISGVG